MDEMDGIPKSRHSLGQKLKLCFSHALEDPGKWQSWRRRGACRRAWWNGQNGGAAGGAGKDAGVNASWITAAQSRGLGLPGHPARAHDIGRDVPRSWRRTQHWTDSSWHHGRSVVPGRGCNHCTKLQGFWRCRLALATTELLTERLRNT